MTPILEFVDAVKSFGQGHAEVYALRGVSLAVQPGEIVAVMGPSGCGKSTMLHLSGGLETPSAGRVLVDGRDLVTCPESSRPPFAAATSGTCSSA
jgi:putative ABC transport system ATP-binding protein